MTIKREVDFLGRVTRRTIPPSGTREVLKRIPTRYKDGDSHLEVKVDQPDKLAYMTKSVTFNPGLLPTATISTQKFILEGEEINKVDLASSRTRWGFRARYRWYPTDEEGPKHTRESLEAFKDVLDVIEKYPKGS